MKNETMLWLKYADENLKSAELLLEEALFNPCLQNAQQAAEKYLKSVLIEKSITLFKTHSINELINKIKSLGIQISIKAEDCDLLDSIYLPSKYPLGCILPEYEPDREICLQCLDIVKRIKASTKKVFIT